MIGIIGAFFVMGTIFFGVCSLIGLLFELIGWVFHLITFGIFRPKPKPPIYTGSDYYPELASYDRPDHYCHCDHDDDERWY